MEWTVLCVSKISPAQITRNMILERAGYRVVAIDDPAEAVRMFMASTVSAVVFGDSIEGEQRFELARTFKQFNRSVPIVALSKTSDSQLPPGLVDEQLESLGDPQLLLETLKRVRATEGSANNPPAHDGDGTSTKIAGSKTPKNSAV
ncbi:MAG TPA: response regulator [Candidatus Acidoferrum sp.]|nr:response regulator [Candidatus Acidoferrum sp.]